MTNHIWYLEELQPGSSKWHTLFHAFNYKNRAKARADLKDAKKIWPKSKFRIAHFVRASRA